MRLHLLTPLLLLLAACRDTLPERLPPSTGFAFPSALLHLPTPGGNGTLYVASSNFDKLFDSGAMVAVNLDSAGQGGVLGSPLPAFGVPPADPIPEITLNVPVASTVLVQSMSGEMAMYRPDPAGTAYFFVPSRAEGDYLQVVEANGAELRCTGTDSRKCFERAFSLTEASDNENGLPGAPAPLGVSIGDRIQSNGQKVTEVWVTHVMSALKREGDNRQDTASTFVVRTNAQGIVDALKDPNRGAPLQLPASDFIPLNVGASLAGAHAVALSPDFAFLSGRVVTSGQGTGGAPPFLLRAISRETTSLSTDPNLRAAYPNIEARGLALNESGTRLFMAGRAAGSTLLVMNVTATPTTLGISLVRALDTLPPGASTVKVLSRGPGRGDLVLITCSTAGVLALYDDEVGDIVAQVPDLGSQPYAVAVEPRAPGARLFVGNFGDGQVSVIDIPNLDLPQEARVVAKLGGLQRCAPGDTDDACPEGAL